VKRNPDNQGLGTISFYVENALLVAYRTGDDLAATFAVVGVLADTAHNVREDGHNKLLRRRK
jgi:hypothetical protein